jgi:hypothetical protein
MSVFSQGKRVAPQPSPEGVVGWLDHQKNENSVSGEVHNKFYFALTDSIPENMMVDYPCLRFCNNRFIFNLLLGVNTSLGDANFKPELGGIRPLFPPRALSEEIDRVCAKMSTGSSFDKTVVEALFVNEEKSWFDEKRRDTFRQGRLVADHNLKLVSGHGWRGGQMPPPRRALFVSRPVRPVPASHSAVQPDRALASARAQDLFGGS